MSPIPAVAQAAATPPADTATMTAFNLASQHAGLSTAASPDAMGSALLTGLNRFNTHEAHFQTVVQQAAGSADASGTSVSQNPVIPVMQTEAPSAMQQGEALQQKSMGLMMQTYSFALEATMVTNAATTFTSSINTLIKTQ